MTLPSERITIKRRLDEEPVEALYLQKKKHRTGDIYWNRVIDSQTTSLPVSSLSVSRTSDKATDYAIDVPQVPHIRTTSPEEDLLSEHASIEAIQRPLTENEEPLNTSEHPKSPDSTNLRESSLNNPNVPRSSAGPRRFHFIKNTSFTFPRTIDPANRVQKQRKKRRSDLPVFVEKSKSKYQLKTRTGVPPRTDEKITKDHANNSPVLGVCEERPRKRPMVSAAEQQWRTANWSNSTKADRVSKQEAKTAQVIDAPSSQWDYSSETLAGQLQQVALQEINLRTAVTEDDKTAPQLKVQPKSPKARQSAVKQHVGTSSEDESMTDLAENENDHNYIYDTYVRSIAQPPGLSVLSSGRDPGPLQATDDSKIGILIIAEEDQEEWETFAEVDQDSDKDWNSEEEDENAEGFYGNDYPEDEVDSDDEFDRGAYNYRAAASDDEEFNQDAENWSYEDETRHPWKNKVNNIHPEGDIDGDLDINA